CSRLFVVALFLARRDPCWYPLGNIRFLFGVGKISPPGGITSAGEDEGMGVCDERPGAAGASRGGRGSAAVNESCTAVPVSLRTADLGTNEPAGSHVPREPVGRQIPRASPAWPRPPRRRARGLSASTYAARPDPATAARHGLPAALMPSA